MSLDETIAEDSALEWFEELRYGVGRKPHPAPHEPSAEQGSFSDVVLLDRPWVMLRGLKGGIQDGVEDVGSQRAPCSATGLRVLSARILHGPLSILLDEGYSRAGSLDMMEACS